MRVFVRKRAQQKVIEDSKKDGGRSNPQSQRKQRRQRNAEIFLEAPQCKSNIAQKALQLVPQYCCGFTYRCFYPSSAALICSRPSRSIVRDCTLRTTIIGHGPESRCPAFGYTIEACD